MQQFIQEIVNGLVTGSTYAVVALGFGLVFSVMRVINMAHPDLAMMGAYAAYVIIVLVLGGPTDLSLVVAIPLLIGLLVVGAAVGGFGGLMIERLVVRPSRGKYLLVPFIATAGVSIFLQNGASAIFGPNPRSVDPILPGGAVHISGVTFTSMQAAAFAISVAMMIALRHYVRATKWGLATRAVADLADVTSACGVNVNAVSRLTIGVASAMAGAAGVIVALIQTQASPFMGLLLGLKSFVCMLVAGNRYIEGILAVGLGLGILEAMVTGYISSQYRDAVAFGLMLVILLFRPSGLFGSYDT